MKITYDKEADAVYIRLSNARTKKTIKIRKGLFVDLDRKGWVRGIEVLHFSHLMPKEGKHVEIGKKKIPIPALV